MIRLEIIEYNNFLNTRTTFNSRVSDRDPIIELEVPDDVYWRLVVRRFIKRFGDHIELFRDDRTGIAWIEDTSTGLRHSAHPNINGSGSGLSCWGKGDRLLRLNGFIYNADLLVVTDPWDQVAADHCDCFACREKR